MDNQAPKDTNVNHLDEIMDYQAEINKSDEDDDKIIKILKKLHNIPVTYNDWAKSKIGITWKQWTKKKNKDISTAAEELIIKWKKIIKKSKEATSTTHQTPSTPSSKQSESPYTPSQTNQKLPQNVNVSNNVKSTPVQRIKVPKKWTDSSIESYRNSIKEMLFESFYKTPLTSYTEDDVCKIIIEIEANMFKIWSKGSKYINRGKAISSNLMDPKNGDFKLRILSRELTPEYWVTMDVKEMVCKEKQAEREQVEKDMFNSMRSDWHDVHNVVAVGMYTCDQCKGKRTTSKEIQMRSADEPMTLFIRCADCGNEWRIG